MCYCVMLAGCNRGYETTTDALLDGQYLRPQSWQLAAGYLDDDPIPVDVPLRIYTHPKARWHYSRYKPIFKPKPPASFIEKQGA